MEEKLVVKGRLEFEGTVKEFEELSNVLSRGSVRLSPENGGGDPTGVWTKSPHLVLGRKRLEAFAENKTPMRVPKTIAGGIQNPHLHINDKVVLLAPEEFKTFVGEVADGLAKQLAAKESYRDTVKAVNNLSVPNRK